MPYFVIFVLLVFSPVAIWIGHAALFRLIRHLGFQSVPPQMIALGTVAIGNGPIILASWLAALRRLDDSPWELVCGIAYVVLTYNMLGFCYLSVLNASETSLHVHILMMLWNEGRITSAQLTQKYSAQEMISVRVDRMISLGQLKKNKEHYVLASRALILVGRGLTAWRRVLGLPLNPGGM